MGEDTDCHINLLNIYLLIVSAYAYASYGISSRNEIKMEKCVNFLQLSFIIFPF